MALIRAWFGRVPSQKTDGRVSQVKHTAPRPRSGDRHRTEFEAQPLSVTSQVCLRCGGMLRTANISPGGRGAGGGAPGAL